MNVCDTCKYRKVFLWINWCRLAKKKYAKYKRWICNDPLGLTTMSTMLEDKRRHK